MIVHLLKLVWNRKGTHLLIMLEVLCSFLVVFALTATGATLLARYRQPLGFDWRDVWVVYVDRHVQWNEWNAEHGATFERLLREVRSLRGVEQVALASNAPYRGSVSVERLAHADGVSIDVEVMSGSVELAEVLGLDLVAGRWFEQADRAHAWEPVVIDRRLARERFGTADALGQPLDDKSRETERRVIGVIDTFRRGGDFQSAGPFAFHVAWTDERPPLAVDTLLIRVAPGTRADFEEPLVERMQAVAGGWNFSVQTLAAAREQSLETWLVPLAVGALIGGFLLLMVVLGLIGVMWQNVTRRTREIGLRRAAGAWRRDIHWQIVTEVMLIAGFGIAAGALIAIQVPLLDGSHFFSTRIVVLALAVSTAFILGLAALCGLYPGWSATRIHPARALHYE